MGDILNRKAKNGIKKLHICNANGTNPSLDLSLLILYKTYNALELYLI